MKYLVPVILVLLLTVSSIDVFAAKNLRFKIRVNTDQLDNEDEKNLSIKINGEDVTFSNKDKNYFIVSSGKIAHLKSITISYNNHKFNITEMLITVDMDMNIDLDLYDKDIPDAVNSMCSEEKKSKAVVLKIPEKGEVLTVCN